MHSPGRHRARLAFGALAFACCVCTTESDCTFGTEIPSDTEYLNLNQDYNAMDSDSCKQNCCDDGGCQVWQYTDYDPDTGTDACMRGDSQDSQDSGGTQWQGESGKADPGPGPAPQPGPDPGPGPGPGPAPGPGHKKPKCVGDDCGSGWQMTFNMAMGGAFLLYCVGGTCYGMRVGGRAGMDALPNVPFWRNMGGLVGDGFRLTWAKLTGGEVPASGYRNIQDVESGQVDENDDDDDDDYEEAYEEEATPEVGGRRSKGVAPKGARRVKRAGGRGGGRGRGRGRGSKSSTPRAEASASTSKRSSKSRSAEPSSEDRSPRRSQSSGGRRSHNSEHDDEPDRRRSSASKGSRDAEDGGERRRSSSGKSREADDSGRRRRPASGKSASPKPSSSPARTPSSKIKSGGKTPVKKKPKKKKPAAAGAAGFE